MKKYLFVFVMILVVVSCGTQDPKTRLEKLMAQREKLDAEIIELKRQIGETDTSFKLPAVTVAIAEMQPQDFKNYIEVQGKIDADENTEAVPQTPGVVEAIYVKEGDHVRKGQLLASLDTRVLRQSAEELKVQLDYATNLFNKQKALWEKNIGSEVQYLTAKNQKESLERRLATLNEQIELAMIKAPVSGTVESVPFKVGQMISPGVPGASIRVINMNSAKVVAELSEKYAPMIKNGAEVRIQIPDLGKETRSKVRFTSRYIDPNNRTFKVEAGLVDAATEYRANMVVVMKINDYTNPCAFVLPLNVIHKSSSGDYVFIAKPQGNGYVASVKPVKIGRVYAGIAEITEGLEEGDKVIVNGYSGLKDGQPVKF
ncbi:MAG: rane fusion protein multidrug efflux system [Bacteroidales bacterium]|jgi:RND family efflux transporter MFP subunit|nr:rane fusion protein multidrug efflux system [Bacteroidales bacterium]MDN5330727.1 rane fusion protein multidrug efflux system [Bacteroidales bacterium]